jgi:glycerophosphoryl diester phosphodiesterase
MCELDVRLTRDGVPVVIHDETVDRTTNGRGAVANMTLAEIKRLDAGGRFGARFAGEQIPTLGEVFDALGDRCGLNIELKAAGAEASVCEMVRVRGAHETAMVSSFDWAALARVKAIDPAIRVGVLADRDAAGAMLAAGRRLDAWAVNPRYNLCTAELVIAAHRQGFKLMVWTVDEPAAMRRMIAYGVDGIMTNYPERLSVLVR